MQLSGLTIAPLLAACLSGGMLGANATTPSQTTGASGPRRAMALTFDDLPYVPAGQPDELAAAQRVTTALLRTLASHSAPAVAFVNEGKLAIAGEVGARTALLKEWVDSGMVLGNHTYSHADLNALSVEEFQNEIVKGGVVSLRLMQPRQPYQRYFRHPQTHTGDTPAKKEAIERFLTARGYKVAPHTIDSADFIFNIGYARSLRAGDQPTANRLRTAYVEFVLAATDFAEQTAPKVFGRDIPQTILLHANDINADSLGEILHRLAGRGYRFVPLDYAMTDPVYQTKDALITRSGPTWLWRWMKSMGQNVSFTGDPEPPQWVIDLSTAKGVQ